MDSRQAFFETLERFKLSAADISRRSEVATEVISKYKTGKQRIRQDTFDKLVDALPDEAKFYYFALRMKTVKKTLEPIPA
jgi:predicted transcriptional regulator